MSTDVRDVEIVEVGPRDGLQNEAALLDVADKVELIRRAIARRRPADRGDQLRQPRGWCRRWPTPRR